MKVLIITTWFYPDTAIGAKRPYYFAKYLAQFDHDVTVLRSGGILETIDPNLNPANSGFRILSYLGENCAAEKFERGEPVLSGEVGKRNFSFLPGWIRQPLVSVYRKAFPIVRFFDWENKAKKRWHCLKENLDILVESGETFDVVVATFGELENLWAGEYASKLFNCPWIMDLRDPIVRKIFGCFAYKTLIKYEAQAFESCTACIVISKGMAKMIFGRHPTRRICVIHNGYEPEIDCIQVPQLGKKLVFCYTGTLYAGKSDLSPIFAVLKELSRKMQIETENIQFHYAGNSFSVLQKQADRFSMASILIDHGYLSRNEALQLQNSADFFIVASWNTEEEQGVLTGKFYEGIRSQKPILSFVTGSVPDSELYLMNEKYHYGLCYEECKKEIQFSALCKYIKEAYDCKMCGEPVKYEPKEGLAVDFCYDELTRKLEKVLVETTSGV